MSTAHAVLLALAFAVPLSLGAGAFAGYRYGARAVGDVRIAADAVKKL